MSRRRRSTQVAKENYTRYKYVLNLPGSTSGSYSRNLNHLWFLGSVVLFWKARFTDGLEHTLSVRERLALPGAADKVVWVSGDATLERVGAIDWTFRRGTSEALGPAFAALRQSLLEAHHGSEEEVGDAGNSMNSSSPSLSC